MFKTALLLLCLVAILVSGIENESLPNIVSLIPNTTLQPSNNTNTSSVTIIPITSTTKAPLSTSTDTIITTLPPTPDPTPVPSPETGKWMVNETKEICIIAQLALQFNVTYITKESETAYKVLNLPVNNTMANGTCGSTSDVEQNITLSWPTTVTNNITASNNLTLHFVKNTAKNQYALHHLEVHFVPVQFPKIATNYSTTFVHKSNQFTTGLNNSYRCLKTQMLNLTKSDNQTVGEIRVSNLQFQAFHVDATTNFGFAEDCAFDTPDIVPIAIGCALAVLVLIVLVVYLVGRRRSQARGYLSM